MQFTCRHSSHNYRDVRQDLGLEIILQKHHITNIPAGAFMSRFQIAHATRGSQLAVADRKKTDIRILRYSDVSLCDIAISQ